MDLALWEKMQQGLDKMFKDTGHVNAYFPLFVPKSMFEAEEQNAEGFAKECAIVTHYRLKTDPENKGKLIVDPELSWKKNWWFGRPVRRSFGIPIENGFNPTGIYHY